MGGLWSLGCGKTRTKNSRMWEIKKIVGCGIFKICLVYFVLMNNYRLIIISQMKP